MDTQQLILQIQELMATITALREQIMGLQKQVTTLQAVKASVATPDKEGGKAAVVDVYENVDPGGPEPIPATLEEALEKTPKTEMITVFEDDHFIRSRPEDVRANFNLGESQPASEVNVRGTHEDDQFMLGRQDLRAGLIDWDTVIRDQTPGNKSSIDGLDGYDEAFIKADADARIWVSIQNLEYLRVDYGPDSGGDCFGARELPESGHVYIDGALKVAEVYDDGFNLFG